jgi:hypothetical protein
MFAGLLAFILSTATLTQVTEGSASGGQIRGRVVDPGGNGIDAFVNIVQSKTATIILRTRADQKGAFQTDLLDAGTYVITLWLQGFRRSNLIEVFVRDGQTTDLGVVRLPIAGCDAPGVMCDYVTDSTPRSEKVIIGSGYLRLAPLCGVDFDNKGTVHCPATSASRRVDIELDRDRGDLYLVAVNGAALSILEDSNADCSTARYGETRMRVNGFGPGVDLCVRSKRGALTHLFFTGDVNPESSHIDVWQITRKY